MIEEQRGKLQKYKDNGAKHSTLNRDTAKFKSKVVQRETQGRDGLR